MQERPSSSRPSTSARPTTAFDRDHFQYLQQHLQRQKPHEIEEESEEESDDEDVFAFLPPTTADQQQSSFSPVAYPEPTFDPWGRQYPTSPPAALPLPPGIPGISSESHSPPHLYNKSPIVPPSPSTDSHPSTGMTGPDFYRLKRLGTAASSKLGVVDNPEETEKEQERVGDNTKNESEKDADEGNHMDPDKETYPKLSKCQVFKRSILSSAQSSSFQHGAGPSHSQSQSLSQTYHKYRQQQHHPGILGIPQAASSVGDSLSMTQSMMEDAEGRSIK